MARMGNGLRISKTAASVFAMSVLAALVSRATAAETAQLLSEKPPRSAATTEFQARTSTIQPSLTVTYDVVADAANAAADRFSGPRSGKSRIGCNQVAIGTDAPSAPSVKVTLFKGCVDFDWHVNAVRNGKITIKREGSGIAVAVPVKFDGNGGFNGDLAKAIQINNKNFSGTFVASISGVVRLDKSFCPKLDQTVTHFAWGTPPDIDIIGRSCLDAGNGLKACIGPWKFPAGAMMTDQINRSLQSQVDEINGKIPCAKIRDQLKQVWKTWSLPVTLGNSPTFFVSVEPKSLTVPGVQVGDDGINLVARLEAATSVSATKPADIGPGELPENDSLPPQPGKFSLAVPLAIPYPLLAAAASTNIIGKPVKSGAQAITPTGMEIFPSGDRLAIGATFRVDGPGKLHGQSGTAWFTATPAVENNGHLIRLRELAMTRKTGNRLWALSAVIRNGLSQAIGKAYSYDLTPLVGDARSKVNEAIKDPKNTGGVKIEVANDDLRLGRTALLPDNFVVEGLFDADVSATLGQMHS